MMDRELAIEAINTWAQNLKQKVDAAAQSLRKDVNDIVRSGGTIESISSPDFNYTMTITGDDITIEGSSESPAIIFER